MEQSQSETRLARRQRIRDERRLARKRKREGASLVAMVVVCLIALTALGALILMLLENRRLEGQNEEARIRIADFEQAWGEEMAARDEAVAEASSLTVREQELLVQTMIDDAALTGALSVLDDLKERLLAAEDMSAIMRALFKKDIVVVAESQYHFIPIDESLAMHGYDPEGFVLDEEGVLTYQDGEGNVLSQKGIDVSRYQLQIEWPKVAADGVDFAFIRLGYRGSTEGTLFLDTYFEENIQGALANGVDVGVYFFTQALNEREAVEEADFVLEHIADYEVNYPVVIDIEAISTNNARTMEMSQDEWTAVAIAFCERIKEAGHTPMIYGNLRSFFLMLDFARLEEYEKWFAFYRTPIYMPYQHSIWQYTAQGKVDGIEGDVDLNVGMKRY